MERLRQSATGPVGNVVLRYGYVPPSLRRMHGLQRSQRVHIVARAALVVLMTLVTGFGTYRGMRSVTLSVTAGALDGSVASSVGGRSSAAAFHPEQAALATPLRQPGNVVVPTVQAAAEGTPVPNDAGIGVSTLQAIPFPGEILLPAAPPAVVVAAPPARVPAVGVAAPLAPTVIPPPALDVAGLRQALAAVTAGSEGAYGICVIDLATNQELDIDDASPMNAASVNKLEILAALYHQVAAGVLRLDQSLVTSAANIQDYGTGTIRYQPLGTRYTLAQLAELLIEQSDNTASYLLAQTIGLGTIDTLVGQWGLSSTIVGQEVSTPRDAARFMALLYHGKLANAADTRQMLAYLTHTAFNDRLPAGLPGNIEVAHKIGTQVNVENDVAIVSLPGRPYIVSVFAKDVTEEHAVPVEQAISRTVYQYEQHAKGGS